jgi:hypothetical protein
MIKIRKETIKKILEAKPTKKELVFILLLHRDKEICFSDVRQYVHVTHSKKNTNPIQELKNIVDFEIEKIAGITIYSLKENIDRDYIKFDITDEELKELTSLEILLKLFLARFDYKDEIFISADEVKNVFLTFSRFKNLFKNKFINYEIIQVRRFRIVRGFTLRKKYNLENKENKTIEKTDVKIINGDNIDRKIKIAQQIEELRKLELEKLKEKNEDKDKFKSFLQNNIEKQKNNIIELLENNQDSLEYVLYNKNKDDIYKVINNHIIFNYLYKNKSFFGYYVIS